MISGHRLVDPAYGQSVEQIMSGEGAYLYGGRWNSEGVRVVYIVGSLSLAAMEQLVHLNHSDILKAFHRLEVSFSETLIQHIDTDDLPSDWSMPGMATSAQATGDAWVASESSLVLQVPSAVIAGEYNYLINPCHRDFSKLRYGAIQKFNFDSRLG